MALPAVTTIASETTLGKAIRCQFPFFDPSTLALPSRHGKQSAYLDSAATCQKPRSVIDALVHFLSHENANIHRGAYALSGEATDRYEAARADVAAFLRASSPATVVFTRGTTDSINLVAGALGPKISRGDVLLLTLLEHHSNIVPWQLMAQHRGARVEFVGIDEHGNLDLADLRCKVDQLHPKVLAVTQVSNALGSVVPLQDVCTIAKAAGCLVVVDAAQSVAHMPIDVAELNCDFLAFSGHKIYGPTGIGVLYGREDLLAELEPVQGGGGMIATVSTTGSTWAESPQRFEAGTPPIAEALALATGLKFLSSIGFAALHDHEERLFSYAMRKLSTEKSVTIYGPAVAGGAQRSIISFSLQGIHPHDFSTIADSFGVQLRAGHHCAMPLLHRLGLQSTVRLSLAMYSCEEDIDMLCEAIRFACRKFG